MVNGQFVGQYDSSLETQTLTVLSTSKLFLESSVPEYLLFALHSVPEGVVLVDLLNRFVHPTKSDPILRHRWVCLLS